MTIVRLASETETPPVDLASWGASGELRIYASTAFYSSENVYVNAGRVGTNDWCQIVPFTIDVDGFITIEAFEIYSTTDAQPQNATYTAVFFDSAGRQRQVKLANFVVDPNGLASSAQSSVLVSGAGSSTVNGTYTFRGVFNGKPYYNLEGFPDSTSENVISAGNNSPYVISDFTGQLDYIGLTTSNYPWLTTYDIQDGDAPSPTVDENVNVISTTWEAVTLSNQGIGINFFNSDTWTVDQIKFYVQSVIANGSNTYANSTIPGITELDVDPVIITQPIAVGLNSPIVTAVNGFQAQIDSLNTLKAPKASPTFTGTVAVTGNLTTTTTIVAGGNISGANLSGTNTGDQHAFNGGTPSAAVDTIQFRRGTAAAWTSANPTLASGEEGLETDTRKTKIGDGVTNWVGLAYTTGTITLTGNVTGSGTSSITTTIANGVVTNAMLAGSIDQSKLAGSIPASKLVQSDIVLTESQITNLTSDLALKANLISPSFTTPALGTITAGVLTGGTTATQVNGTNNTTLASTAFVQSLGNGILRYEVTLTQSSTSAPVAQVLVNSLGTTITWARTSSGLYTGTAGAGTPFTANKTVMFLGMPSVYTGINDVIFYVTRTSSTVITIRTNVQTSGLVDGQLSQVAFFLWVYP